MYDKIYRIDTNREIIEKLRRPFSLHENANAIIADHNPPWYKIFSPRGRAVFFVKSDNQHIGEYTIQPSFFHARTIAMFLIWNIPLWFLLSYLFPWSPVLLLVMVIEWFIMAFIAIPLLILLVFIASCYMLWVSPAWATFFFVILCFTLVFLLIDASLRYNRSTLESRIRMAVNRRVRV